MTKIEVTQNDSLYDLNFTLQDADEVAFDLTDAIEIRLKVQEQDSDELKVDGFLETVSASDGTCKYTVQAADFDVDGKYYAEIEVTMMTGQIITWDDILVVISPDLPR
jgi:Na+-transporting NADH:ubiquinone oxidoreductase subunit NqrF